MFAAVNNAPEVFFCQNNQWAISVPTTRQSRVPLVRPRRRLRHPVGPRRRQRRARQLRGHARRRSSGRAAGGGPDVHRGRHLPHGRAHHARRPHAVPLVAPRRSTGASATRSTACGTYLQRAGRGHADVLRRPGGRGRRARRAHARAHRALDGTAERRRRCSTTSTPTPHSLVDERARLVRAVRGLVPRRGRGEPPMTTTTESPDAQPAAARRRRADADRRQTLPMAKAINVGLRRALERDAKVLLMGEDIGPLGGVFRVTDGLQTGLRRRTGCSTPRSPSPASSAPRSASRCAGTARCCEIQFDGFIFPAFDQITTQLAKMHYRSRGRLTAAGRHPGAVRRAHRRGRAPPGVARGATSRTPPACAWSARRRPNDAYTMIQEAIASPDPVLFFEPKGRYWEKGEVDLDAPRRPALAGRCSAWTRPAWSGRGTDVTLVAHGPMVATALQAAEAAADGGHERRGRRPALALAAGHRDDRRLGAPHRVGAS